MLSIDSIFLQYKYTVKPIVKLQEFPVMPHKKTDISLVKLKMLDYLKTHPDISDYALGKQFGMDYRTAGKYRVELEELIKSFTSKISEKFSEKIDIWRRITGR